MKLSVRRKLQILLAGSLAGALLLVALALAWIIDMRHEQRAGHETHGVLLDIGRFVADLEKQLSANAEGLAKRRESVTTLGHITDDAAQAGSRSLGRDEEKKLLALELLEAVEAGEAKAIAAYDGNARIVAYARGADRAGAAGYAGFATWEEGRYRTLGTTAGSDDWVPRALPANVPAEAAAFGQADATATQAHRIGRELIIEAIAPVKRQRGGATRTVGWLRAAMPLAKDNLDRLAAPRNISVDLLFSGDFDPGNPYGLTPADFSRAPELRALRGTQPPHGSPHAAGHYFYAAAALPLVGNETAWLLAAIDRATVNAEQRRMQTIVLAVLAGTLLLAMPLAGWLTRRWINSPLETLRDGVHTYIHGGIDKPIELYSEDEFGALAEDFNLLAIALRVREIAVKEAEERWRAMIEAMESSDIGLYIVDAEFRLLYASRNLQERHVHRGTGLPCHLAIFGKEEPCAFCPLDRVIDHGETVRLQPPPVEGHSYDMVAMPVGDNGNRRNLMALIQDVTERVAAERAIREAATVFEATSEGIMITDAKGVIKRVNPSFSVVTGYTEAEAVGQTPRLLKSGRHGADFYAEMWESLQKNGRWEGEVWNRRKNGEIFPVWQIISAMKDAAGGIAELVSLFIDITQKKRSEAEIAYRANYDALTDLPNRALLTERLGQAMKQARREHLRIAVLFVDLDFFKQVNDTLGHAIGDRLLQMVAERMRLCVRETDTIARQGGDEFVVLLAGIADAADAGIVAEKIIAQMTQPFLLDDHEIHIGASIGITLFPDDGNDIETLFRNADLAMYRAKGAGRNNAQFFELAMTTAAIERRALEADLRGALARNEFRLHYQPVIDLATGAIVGAEALLRWQHGKRGQVSPEKFIPLAEETGLIREIGNWVFETGCRQLAAWQDAGHRLTLAINVSVRQLPEALSMTCILATLERYGLSPRNIVLEITEGALLADSPSIQEWFVAAGKAGLQLAIDDFGTGYSSLAYLKRFPVHHVKIDKGFICDMAENPADRALVEAILAMAHSLGLSVVAEGVETADQAGLLQARACEQAQGFLYSRAVAAEEFTAMLAQPSAG
jgi:diguanylate cyclase (GGDEF)-like protein/PAS domain S-box-containing protein